MESIWPGQTDPRLYLAVNRFHMILGRSISAKGLKLLHFQKSQWNFRLCKVSKTGQREKSTGWTGPETCHNWPRLIGVEQLLQVHAQVSDKKGTGHLDAAVWSWPFRCCFGTVSKIAPKWLARKWRCRIVLSPSCPGAETVAPGH